MLIGALSNGSPQSLRRLLEERKTRTEGQTSLRTVQWEDNFSKLHLRPFPRITNAGSQRRSLEPSIPSSHAR